MMSYRRIYLGLPPAVIACAILLGISSPAWAVFDSTVKSFGGVDWGVLNDYGITETQLSASGNPLNGGSYLTFRNTQAGNNTTTVGGAGIWLNSAASSNTTGTNIPFWEAMRSSSYSANDTTQWVRWTQRMNYSMGTSQNDLTFNGPGGTATSVAGGSGPDGTLPYEPPAFGGDRWSIGSQFGAAYDIHVKGTGAGALESQGYNAGASTAWNAAGSPALGLNHVLTPAANTALGGGGTYVAQNGDIVEITVGKRADGTMDIYWKGPQIKGTSPSHFTTTMSTDNPDWFFYQLEIRARGSNGTPQNSEQDLLLFQYGNDWGFRPDGVWGVLSEYQAPPPAPEPGSLTLLGLGSLLLAARRRKS